MPALTRITSDDLHRRRWHLLALTSIGAFMAPLDGSIVSVALPSMSPDLGLSFAASMWVQAAYLLAMAVLLVPLGRLADNHGRVRFYVFGLLAFTVGSLAAGLSMNGAWLIGSRVVQGAGGALMSATSAAIITATFPPQERGRALGINVMAVYVGLSVGPPLGGALTDTLGWRWVFFITVPIGIIAIVLVRLLLPRDESDTGATPRLDLAGSALLCVFLGCLLVPLTFASQWGWLSARTVTLLALSAAGLVAFVLVELRVDDPVFDLDLLRHNRLFATASGAALLNYLALYAISVLTAIYLQVVQGRSASLTGWLMLGQPVMMAALSPVAGRLSDRVGSRVLTSAGMGTIAVGMLLLAAMSADSGMGHVLASLAVVGLGMAAFSAPNMSAIMGSVGRSQLSLASAFMSTMRATGQALSMAVLGGVVAAALGAAGGRLLFTHGMGGSGADIAEQAVGDYARGYRYAMLVGVALVLCGAALSLTRPSGAANGAAQAGQRPGAGLERPQAISTVGPGGGPGGPQAGLTEQPGGSGGGA